MAPLPPPGSASDAMLCSTAIVEGDTAMHSYAICEGERHTTYDGICIYSPPLTALQNLAPCGMMAGRQNLLLFFHDGHRVIGSAFFGSRTAEPFDREIDVTNH